MPERTPEQREADRLAREAKRAKREGRAAPTPPPNEEPILPGGSPATTGQDHSPETPPETPPATGREWRRAAGDPDPDPPLVRRVESATEREQVHGATGPAPEPAQPETPARRIPAPPPISGEKAIGTKKVSGGHRLHRPHLPRRANDASPPPPRGGTQTQAAAATSGRRLWTRRAGVVVALGLVAAILWFMLSLFQPFSGDGTGSTVVVIPKNATIDQIADLLEKDGVISSVWFFKLRAKLEGKDDHLNSGRIAMKHDMSYSAALDALTAKARPLPKLTRFTIPEGRSRSEVADDVAEAGIPGDYVQASRSNSRLDPRKFGAPKGATLEGFLFPATYDLRKTATADTLVGQQLKAFRRNVSGLDLRYAHRKNLTLYDVLVIASMIEREAGIPADRRRIAAVIYNRLKQGMPLGIDATLRFAFDNWTKPLTVSELNSDSPYNTRKHTGLPPTPIGSPGVAAIQAAAHPAKVPYLFYVVRPCGNGASNFSSTDAEFQKDVDAYNAKREELGGKSPVTCR